MTNKNYNKEYYLLNKSVIKLRSKQWYLKNKDKAIESSRKSYFRRKKEGTLNRLSALKSRLKHRYNISLEEHTRLCSLQDNKCAICKQLNKLYVDHDHKTGYIRGMLCRECNIAIGLMKDNVNYFKSAVEYINGGSNGTPPTSN